MKGYSAVFSGPRSFSHFTKKEFSFKSTQKRS